MEKTQRKPNRAERRARARVFNRLMKKIKKQQERMVNANEEIGKKIGTDGVVGSNTV